MANQNFTERDKEYLHCLAQGLTDVQIAEKMKTCIVLLKVSQMSRSRRK